MFGHRLRLDWVSWKWRFKQSIHSWLHRTWHQRLVPIKFILADLPDDLRATVDGHSSSPAFVHEHEQKMIQLAMRGALSPEMLVRSIHPPHEDEIIDDIAQRAADQAEMIKEHPELLTHGKKPKM